MVRMLKKLYDSGVQIVAGTDAGSGYAFDRELEIYNESGIPATEVLRMATLEAATVMHNPTEKISNIRHVDTVIKNGNVYRPSEMYPAFGIRAE